MGHDRVEVIAEMDDLDALFGRDARDVLGRHLQQDDAPVQHLVVLEIVEQRHRYDIDPAGQIDGGSRHARFVMHLGDEIRERQRIALELSHQRAPALPPGRHREEQQRSDHQRHPTALDDLHQIGGNERQINRYEHAGDPDGQRQTPPPHLAHGQENQHRGQQHRQ